MKLWWVLGFAFVSFSLLALAAVITTGDSRAAQNLQGDLDCSGEVQPKDAITAARFTIGIDYDGPCLLVAGDLNCDGLINEIDMLWIMLALADLPAEPSDDCVDAGDALPADEASLSVVIDLEVTARL